MFPSSKNFIFNAAITQICLSGNNSVNILDNSRKIHTIDMNSLDITKNSSITKMHEGDVFEYHVRPYAMHENLIYMSINENSQEFIFENKSRVEQRVEFSYSDENKVTEVVFSENGQYIVVGNEEGRAYVVDSNDGSIKLDFYPSTDAISAVAISDDNSNVAITSFSKTLSVMYLLSFEKRVEVDLDAVAEKITFLNENTVLVVTRDARILKVDLILGEIIDEVALPHGNWPSDITMSLSKKYIYIGSRESNLCAFHIETLSMVFDVEIKKGGITAFLRTEKYFVIGFVTGEVVFYSHRDYEEDLLAQLQLKNVEGAVEVFHKNIFLSTNREVKKIYEIWNQKKGSLTTMLSNGSIEEAQKISKPFLFHPRCLTEYSELELLQPQLVDLQRYFKSKSYSMAYSLVEKYNVLEDSMVYKQMEKVWMKSLQKAQILLSKDPVLNVGEAKDGLIAFYEIKSKKSVIDSILNNAKVFEQSQSAIKRQDFALYFRLVNEYSFLKLSNLYDKVLNLAQNIQIETLKLIYKEDYGKANDRAKLLASFPPYKEQALRFIEIIKSLLLIEKYLDRKNLVQAVMIQSKNDIYGDYKVIERLSELKLEFVKKLIGKIKENDLDNIYKEISLFFDLKGFKKEVAIVMRFLYTKQIESNIQFTSLKIDWDKTFRVYFSYFSLDNMMLEILKKADLCAGAKTIIKEKHTKPKEFIKDIIQVKEKSVKDSKKKS